MTIFDHLRRDHQIQRSLLAKLAETAGDSDARNRLFASLREELETHAIAEEHVLYSRMMTGESRDKAVHSVAEHKALRDLVDELIDTEMSSPAWLPKLRTLREKVEHHLDEEESETFVEAQEQLSELEVLELAIAFNRRSDEARAEIESAAGK